MPEIYSGEKLSCEMVVQINSFTLCMFELVHQGVFPDRISKTRWLFLQQRWQKTGML